MNRVDLPTMSDHKQALPPGFTLGSYRILRVIGVGGFGVTYLCEHSGLGIQVAVKEYLPNEIAVRDGTEVHAKSAGDREGFEWGLGRFLDEARTLARFEHPNVVRVRDCFEANHTAYIVMDYEDGEPLDALLSRLGTLTEAQLKRVVLPLADGLRQVHAAGFLHRDVKPSNVFVRRSDESPVLLDFGSARQALGHRSRSVTAIASAGYSPPEQYGSTGEHGPWTDIYALSALCYRAITGKAPLEAPWRQSELLRKQADPVPSLANAGLKGYTPAFLQAVDRGLRVIETERPQSVDEWLAQGLRATARTQPSSEPTEDLPKKGNRLRNKALAGAAITAVVAIGLVLYVLRALNPQRAPFSLATEPTYAEVALVDSDESYQPGMPLALGSHRVTVSAPGHDTKQVRVEHDGTAPYRIALERTMAPFTVATEPADADVSLVGVRDAYRPGMPLALGFYRVAVSAPGYVTKRVRLGHNGTASHRVALERSTTPFTGGQGPPMVVVPAGSFMMGAAESELGSEGNERPQRMVSIPSLAVGVHEVTFAEWDACAVAGGCDGYRPDDEGWGRGDRPVINVSWEDAQRYVEWLSHTSGHSYRLLTESEWEYAARAGTVTPFHTGATITPQQANFSSGQTVSVGSFTPNGFGLHDMHGNVYEWVQDCWNVNYVGAPVDGSAWATGHCYHRVLRGGSWVGKPRSLRSANRSGAGTGLRVNYIGFRVARTLTP